MSSITPDAVFADLHRAARERASARLFTVTVLDRAAGLARRAYTSHPADYPVSGTKPIPENAWTAQVLGAGRSFVANSTAELAPYFPDHAQINALGCESALNIPVKDDFGHVVGTVNLLDSAGEFTPDAIARLEALIETYRDELLAALAQVPMFPR